MCFHVALASLDTLTQKAYNFKWQLFNEYIYFAIDYHCSSSNSSSNRLASIYRMQSFWITWIRWHAATCTIAQWLKSNYWRACGFNADLCNRQCGFRLHRLNRIIETYEKKSTSNNEIKLMELRMYGRWNYIAEK